MEWRAQRHAVDHQLDAVVQLKPDNLHEVPRVVWTDRKHPRRVSVRFKCQDSECIVDCMENCLLVKSVFVCRAVKLHRSLTYYEILSGQPRFSRPQGDSMLCATESQ